MVRAIVAGLVVGLALLTAVELADLLVHVDNAVLDALVAHRTARWTAFATAVTNTGASPFTYPLVAVAGLVVARRTRRWRPGVVALGVVVLGVLSRLLLSVLVTDARPNQELWLVPVGGYSFPSGHAAASVLLAGALIWLAGRAGLPRPAAARARVRPARLGLPGRAEPALPRRALGQRRGRQLAARRRLARRPAAPGPDPARTAGGGGRR